MLRFALFIVLLANAGYLAWSQGWMASLGWTPENPSEAYRLQQQVRPDVVRIVATPPASAPVVVDAAPLNSPALAADDTAGTTPAMMAAPSTQGGTAPLDTAIAAHNISDAPSSSAVPVAAVAPAAASETRACWQSDTLDEAQFKKLQPLLQRSPIPISSWQVQTTEITGRWMVYIGKLPNDAALEKRRAELRARKIGFDRAGGVFDPGLSLGRFSSQEAAARELANMQSQGIRGARVVQERAPSTQYTVRFAKLTPTQRTALQNFNPAFAGKQLQVCSKP